MMMDHPFLIKKQLTHFHILKYDIPLNKIINNKLICVKDSLENEVQNVKCVRSMVIG